MPLYITEKLVCHYTSLQVCHYISLKKFVCHSTSLHGYVTICSTLCALPERVMESFFKVCLFTTMPPTSSKLFHSINLKYIWWRNVWEYRASVHYLLFDRIKGYCSLSSIPLIEQIHRIKTKIVICSLSKHHCSTIYRSSIRIEWSQLRIN